MQYLVKQIQKDSKKTLKKDANASSIYSLTPIIAPSIIGLPRLQHHQLQVFFDYSTITWMTNFLFISKRPSIIGFPRLQHRFAADRGGTIIRVGLYRIKMSYFIGEYKNKSVNFHYGFYFFHFTLMGYTFLNRKILNYSGLESLEMILSEK